MYTANMFFRKPAPTREDVVNAWRKVSAQGFEDPLDATDFKTKKPKTKEAAKAKQLFDMWRDRQGKAIAADDTKRKLEFRFEETTLFYDAGFRDETYLFDLANDWLMQDEDVAREHELTDLAERIANKRAEINKLLGEE